mgnify:CR=1 FL=1
MKTKYIMLRNRTAVTHDPFMGPSAIASRGEMGLPEVLLEVDEFDRRQLSSVSQKADVVAIAPVMPMKLITPVDLGTAPAAEEPPAPTVTWGVKAVKADTSPFTGDGIVVAVLDTGIESGHPAFTGVDLIQQDFTGEGNGDKNGHGTHCAGTIFGRDTKDNRIGIARGVKKALIGKVLGEEGGSSEQIGNAILWAVENGANVISMSLGIDFPGYVKYMEGQGMPTELATSVALEGYRANTQFFATLAAFVRARGAFAQPTVIVAAAGNESQRDVNPDWEIAVAPPAVSEGIISVAALGESSEGFVVAPFSNTGANVSGPGVRVLSAWIGGRLRAISGTSMATPHTAGVAALWAEKIKATGRLSSMELTARLVASGTIKGLKPGFDPFDVGTGMVQAPQE